MSLVLGIDLGTSFVKVSVMDTDKGKTLVSIQYPETEAKIISKKPGWAEQSAHIWWQNISEAIHQANASGTYDPTDISAIGIAYQMHGLVLVDRNNKLLRDAIIWCDSRATDPLKYPFGNFTAGKLAWVKEFEPKIFRHTAKVLLPGDYIAMKLTGEVTTTPSALSEGMFWDFKKNSLAERVFYMNGFEKDLIPPVKNVFDIHGYLKNSIARKFGFDKGVPVCYKSGDQLNNAVSLNVLKPGEFAATAGTSGVIYGVTDKPFILTENRVNAFAHVNHSCESKRFGVLLCINGCGSSYGWMKKNFAQNLSYAQINDAAASAIAGSDGLQFFPFGNGAERMLNNKTIGAQMLGLDFNRHKSCHMFRAGQEGIAFSLRFGLDIMKESGIEPKIIRAAHSGLFMSRVFSKIFSDVVQVPVELYETNGAAGAALGAAIGLHIFSLENAFENQKPIRRIEPDNHIIYNEYYQLWKQSLASLL